VAPPSGFVSYAGTHVVIDVPVQTYAMATHPSFKFNVTATISTQYNGTYEVSVALVEAVHNLSSPVIANFAQRDPGTNDPGEDDLFPVGCAARVLKVLKHSSGNSTLILQGLTRIRLEEVTQESPFLRAKVRRVESPLSDDVESEALAMSLRECAKQVIQFMPDLQRETASFIDSIQAPGSLADLVAANLDVSLEDKAQLIEAIDVKERIRKVLRLLTRQLEMLKMRGNV
jgi:ATP-dependent Lon protease